MAKAKVGRIASKSMIINGDNANFIRALIGPKRFSGTCSTLAQIRIKYSTIKIVTEKYHHWYPGALCLKHRDRLGVRGNWFEDSYRNIAIAITMCDENIRGKRCASREKTVELLQT